MRDDGSMKALYRQSGDADMRSEARSERGAEGSMRFRSGRDPLERNNSSPGRGSGRKPPFRWIVARGCARIFENESRHDENGDAAAE